MKVEAHYTVNGVMAPMCDVVEVDKCEDKEVKAALTKIIHDEHIYVAGKLAVVNEVFFMVVKEA